MIVLHGRGIVGGCAEGEALVTRETISGWGGIDPMTGTVIETRHELRGAKLQRQSAGVSGREGIVGVVERVSHDAADEIGAAGDGV